MGFVRWIEAIPHRRLCFLVLFSLKQTWLVENKPLLFFFPTKLHSSLLAPNRIAAASHPGGKAKRPQNFRRHRPILCGERAPSSSGRPPQRCGRKGQIFLGVLSLRVTGWGFTFGLNFRSQLPQRRLFNTCSLVPTSSSLRGARR